MKNNFGQFLWEPSPAPPCVFVIFGATGDLMAKKVAPALYNLTREGLLGEDSVFQGIARRPRSDEQFRAEMLEAIKAHSRTQPIDEKFWQEFSKKWYYTVTHADAKEEFESLAQRLDELDKKHNTRGNRVFYLAMPPDSVAEVSRNLTLAKLNKPKSADSFVRVVVEKPFGKDLSTARKLNKTLLADFDESQIYRIDHYLGKETVQNILIFRFANAIFDQLFNREYVDHVEITTAETAGMEGRRGAYYETTGALGDMVQNHMLQLLALVAMEVPTCIHCDAVRDEKAKVLQSLLLPNPKEVQSCTVRGQYVAGKGTAAYRQEKGVAEDSQVETFAAIKLFIDNWRWSGVPFYLRTGKRLAAKTSGVVIVFKREPISFFENLGCDVRGNNRLVFRIYPNEGISLIFDSKVPGPRMILRPVEMNFRYDAAFASASPEAYEHLILDAALGDSTLFIRNDEVEAAWAFVDRIKSAWKSTNLPDLIEYDPGSWGPDSVERLFEDPYKRWYNI